MCVHGSARSCACVGGSGCQKGRRLWLSVLLRHGVNRLLRSVEHCFHFPRGWIPQGSSVLVFSVTPSWVKALGQLHSPTRPKASDRSELESSSLSPEAVLRQKLATAVHAYSLSTWKAGAGGSLQTRGQPWLHRDCVWTKQKARHGGIGTQHSGQRGWRIRSSNLSLATQ